MRKHNLFHSQSTNTNCVYTHQYFSNIHFVISFVFLFFSGMLYSQDVEQIVKSKPFELSGNLSLQGQLYSISGAAPRQPWNSYVFSGSPVISIYGFQLPFSFVLSNNQRDFLQPFNQIGVSPQYKWIKLHAGYRNISFSQFGMAGHTLLGGGIELTPGKFRFSALYGRTNKAIAEDTSNIVSDNINTLSNPTYRQMLLAVKVGIGTTANFVDLYFLKGKDDSTSLPYKPVNTKVLPEENLVMGLMHKFSFLKKKIEWQSEVAASLFTRDITMSPIDLSEIKYVKNISSLMSVNLSSSVFTALESQVKYKHKLFAIGAKYRRVEPDYKSMGAYYSQTDLEQYTGNFSTRLLKNKFIFNVNAGIQKDNLIKNKMATTRRNIYSAIANYTINKHLGININYSNYGTAQKAGNKSLSDTSQINQISNLFTLAPYYTFQQKSLVHTFFLIFGNQNLNDKNKYTSDFTEMGMIYSNLNYSLTDLDAKTNYIFGLNYSKSTTVESQMELLGFNLGAGKTWWKDKMNTDLSLNANSTKFNGTANGYIATLALGNSYQILKKQSLRLQLNWLLNESKNDDAGSSFNEFTTMIQYRYSF